VNVEKLIPAVRADAFSARPVTMPGSAIGRTSASENTSRPKNLKRWTANAASEPRAIAIRLDRSPTWMDRPSAARTDGLSHADPNHSVLNWRMGQTWIRSALNA